MAVADTARLLASLELKDNFTKTAKAAEASLGRLEKRVGGVGGIAAKGIKTLGSNLKNLVTGPAGLIAGGAAVFALTNFISGSVDKARAFGEAVFKVRAIIGGATEDVSRLVDVLGDYGVESDAVVRIGGLFEKNLAALTKTGKAAAKFQQDYGIALVDSKGRAKDFNAVLLDAADLFTSKTIPQSTKAAALAKLYGRNWQALIPILAKGRAGLEAALGKGIALSDAQAKSLEKARKAGIKWEDAIGDLQTMIGIELLPVITKFVNKLTRFVQDHGDDIRKFFRDAATFAMGMGRAIKQDVLPALGKIGDIWNGIPDDLKKILIGGFVVNKLSGGAITGIFSELAKGLIKGVLGINAGVVNLKAATVVGGGGVPGGPTGGGIGSKVAEFGVLGVGLANLATIPDLLGGIEKAVTGTINLDPAELAAGIRQGMEGTKFNPWGAATNALLGAMLPQLDILAGNTGAGGSIAAAFEASAHTLTDDSIAAAFGAIKTLAPKTDPKIIAALKALKNPKVSDSKLTARIHDAISAIRHGADISVKGIRQLESSIRGRLRDAIQRGDATLARKLENQLGVLHQIRNKKMQVKVNQKQRQSLRAIATVNSSGAKASGGKDDVYQSSAQSQDYSRFLASGAVGLATKATPAIFGEAGREAYAILKNPRSGMLGGGGPPVVHVHVNIDPRRITRKQTASGVYKTYVAT